MTDDDFEREAEEEYARQPKEIVNPPEHSHIISFTRSLDIEKAKQQIAYAKENFFFERDNVLEVARKYDLPLPDEEETGTAIIEGHKETEQKARDEEVPQEVIDLIRQIKPAMESLFSDLKENVGFDYDNRIELEEGTICWLDDQDDQVIKNLFKKEYFKDQEIYSTEPKQIPRDFIGALLKKIVKDQLRKKIGGQRLYEIYKEI